MRKMCDSSKTRPTASLIVLAVARSVPIGFSRTTRERSVASADLVEVLADRAEQCGRDREVEDADDVLAGGALLEPGVQLVPGPDVLDVEGHVMEATEQAAYDGVAQLVGRDVLGEGLLDQGPVAVVVDLGARDADDPEAVGQLPVAVAEVEGGQQLAEGEVAGAAEDGEVTRLDGGAGNVRLAVVGDRRSVHGSPPYAWLGTSTTYLRFFVYLSAEVLECRAP